ncbi:MAG: argininosuccinate lyase [Fusobacteriaceae bacterium]|jgi:argininosuccinate lyase|nr:argininosuccinate lyase [Fusobacteriaceae bacterium]MBP6467367.1 argininosuccinate lyase [Fusobacteriaceae bacterium]MBP9596207.1 argininosuccinate lyase [Fusobacteriaceae bacterium]
MKLWGGRFNKGSSSLLEQFNASIGFDNRMYAEDIAGSIAHSKMLNKIGILTVEEQEKIENGLIQIKEMIDNGNFEFHISDEDIHMAVEKKLIELIGSLGGKLHTGRSRNDQVALDIRMYLKKEILNIKDLLKLLMEAIVEVAESNKDVIMPGYTHLQRAQPILFSHHMMAYYEMMKRDLDRLEDCFKRVDVMPLGAGALAGTTYPLDRHYVAELLGFSKVTENSLDTVSDRDFIIETNFVISMIIMHLSRFSEELIIWSTSEFSFVEMDDTYSTGSSIMPQKKNPDVTELVRGKTGRVFGNLMGIFTVMKGLPLAYNKDTQEDKEGVFDSIDTIKIVLEIFSPMLKTMTIKKENMKASIYEGFINATDIADYLAKKGLPFREAHKVVGELVSYCEQNNKLLTDLSYEEFKNSHSLFEEDIVKESSIEACINGRKTYGGTALSDVERQIENAKAFLGKN